MPEIHEMNEHTSVSPYAPTRFQAVLLAIGFLLAIDRHSSVQLLPFSVGLVGGSVPVECIIWASVLAQMAAKDIIQSWAAAGT